MSGRREAALSFEAWVEQVFSHAVPTYEPPWYFSGDDELWNLPAGRQVEYLTRLFNDPVPPLDDFADSQIAQGLHYLIDSGAGGHVRALFDAAVPLPDRLRGIASIARLFALLLAPRCTPHLGHRSEAGAGPLNNVCYMWWDIFAGEPVADPAARSATENALLDVMAATLQLEAPACQEAALHGLGHWSADRSRVGPMIDAFLARRPAPRPDLVAYAQAARTGCVN